VHPGAWIVWALGGALVAMSTTNPFYLLPLAAVCYFVHAARGAASAGPQKQHGAASAGPQRQRGTGGSAGSFKVFVLFGLVALVTRTVLVFFGPVTPGSVVAAALEGLRLAAMLAVFGTFNSVADPFRLLKLSPRRFHEPALAAALALSIAPRTIVAAGRVREAQRLRGIDISGWRALPALAVPVLATGMEEAVTLAESMDSRGHGRGRRSRYRPERWGAAAWATAAIGVAAAFAFVGADGALGGGLEVSTYPLVWPAASPWLVGAALSLAVPGLLPAGPNHV